MDILGSSITAAGAAAQARVASALVPKVSPKATAAPAGDGNAAANAAGTITSNDFLTLLVSELKNQDPTKPTDPNAYIQQLVGVNSLQQLIQINKGLTNLEPASAATPSTGAD